MGSKAVDREYLINSIPELLITKNREMD